MSAASRRCVKAGIVRHDLQACRWLVMLSRWPQTDTGASRVQRVHHGVMYRRRMLLAKNELI